ncbi:MAG: hypothetical protein J5I94_29530 [Phaeodactylibacter sp.]|nr:hypothetical protein [Phaeodactylibacter sp.]
MKGVINLLTAFLLFPICLFGQASSEAGVFIGVANYMGDLAPSPLAANETRIAFGGHFRRMLNPKAALKGSVSFGKLTGADANIPMTETRVASRGWEMSTGILEAALQMEWHPLGGPRFNNAGVYQRQISPFIGAGLGLAFGDAKVKVPQNDQTRFPEADDKSAFIVFPMTLGIRFDVTESLIVTGEFSVRGTFTDYLDGVSENGNPGANDHYMFGGISILYLIEADYGPSYSN